MQSVMFQSKSPLAAASLLRELRGLLTRDTPPEPMLEPVVSKPAGSMPLATLSSAMRIAALLLVFSGVAWSGSLIPAGSLIYVDDSNEWLGHVRAEIIKQGLPVRITVDPEQAQYWIRGHYEDGSGALELVSQDGVVIWAERYSSQFKFRPSASRNLVKKLAKAMRRRTVDSNRRK